MTDHKPWLWRRKSSSDKGDVVVAGKAEPISKENGQEMRNLLLEKAELERNLEDLRDRLSAAISECNDKHELAEKHATTAQEAIAGWEKAEAKALSLKQELNIAVQGRAASEMRTSQLDAALKECVQQLQFVREQHESRIHDVLTKAMKEFEHDRLDFEDKLGECGKVIAKLSMENDQLTQILLQKEQLIDDLNQQRIEADSELRALLARLESMEKDKDTLKYEIRLLEKELDIRNEERDFNQRATDATHKQHLDNVKKIARLESECQRLRVLVKKRLPGPAAIARMKTEVEMLERSRTDNRRKKLHVDLGNPHRDYAVDTVSENMSKKISLLVEKLCSLEEENSALRESLHQKTDELQSSRNLYAQAAARLYQAESELEDSPRSQKITGLKGNNKACFDAGSSISDVGKDAGSWACALITELESFRDGKQKGGSSCKSTGTSDISMTDDFVEMEKLALVCVDEQTQYPCHETSDATLDESPQGSTGNAQQKIGELVYGRTNSHNLDPSESPMSSCKSPEMVPSVPNLCSPIGENAGDIDPKLKGSATKLVGIIEGIKASSQQCDSAAIFGRKIGGSSANENPGTASGYTLHVFQGKTCELDSILQSFLHTCSDMLNGKADVGTFVQELSSTLEWILSHSFPLKDVINAKDAIRGLLDWDELKGTSEPDVCVTEQPLEVDKSRGTAEQVGHHLPGAAACFDGACTEAELERGVQSEHKDIESAGGGSEGSEQSDHQVDDSSCSNHLPREAEMAISASQANLEGSEPPKGMIEDETENLHSHLSASRVELNETLAQISSPQVDSETKSNPCMELKTTCHELQLQHEGATMIKGNEQGDDWAKQLTDQEILAASEKLAHCQDTILNLGKQLKALASPNEAALFDKLISAPALKLPTINEVTAREDRKMDRGSSLLDKMLAEEDDSAEGDHELQSPQTEEIMCNSVLQSESREMDSSELKVYDGVVGSDGNREKSEPSAGSYNPLAIVPSRKKDGGFFRKLLWRRKKRNSKKLLLPFPVSA